MRNAEFAEHYERLWLDIDRKSRTMMGDFVYIAKRGNQYKVGYSTNPIERVKSLNATLVVAVDGSRIMEKEIHNLLDRWRLNGEWFSDDPYVTDFVADFSDMWEQCHSRIEIWIRGYDQFMLTRRTILHEVSTS